MISIAMATFNGDKYLQEQLDSFVAQTRQPDELVVCDDGSVDKTLEILEKFTKGAPFKIRIYRNKIRLGYAKNFAQAISYCHGDLIFLSDQDDVWLTEKIAYIVNIFYSNPEALVVMNNMDVCSESLLLTGLTTLGQVRSAGMNDEVLSYGCSTTFRSSLKNLILPIPDSYSHDVWVNQLGKSLNGWFLVPHSLQLYRRHASTSSNWITSGNKPIRRKDLYTIDKSSLPWDSYVQRRILLEEVINRIRFREVELLDALEKNIDISSSISRLINEVGYINQRVNLMQKNVIQRKFLAMKLLFSGGYRYFSGIKSFAKDFLT